MSREPEAISVTELRERTREILENVHFRGQRYVIRRAGQEMVVILGVEEYQRWLRRMLLCKLAMPGIPET